MKRFRVAACAVALTAIGLTLTGLSPAAAETASAAVASGYGANVNLAGTAAVNKAGLATAVLPPGGDVGPNSLVLVPADPIAVSGTAIGLASAHADSDIVAELDQAAPGPFNAQGGGLVEDLEVLLNVGEVGQSLLSATAVAGEAVGVCRGRTAVYSANSDVADLAVGGTALPVNAPLSDLIDAVSNLVDPLSTVVDIKRNEVAVTAQGASVNALHVTLLGAVAGIPTVGAAPLLDLIVGHAEVGGLQCPRVPQCSDTVDNDGDGVIDARDPGCINNGVYDPTDDDETDSLPRTVAVTPGSSGGSSGELARTGGDDSSRAPLAAGLAMLAIGALALRRRNLIAR